MPSAKDACLEGKCSNEKRRERSKKGGETIGLIFVVVVVVVVISPCTGVVTF